MLLGRTALVTGGARGIGRATAEKLAEHGADVAICDLEMDGGAEVVRTVSEKLGRKALPFAGDIASPEDVRRLFARIEESFGRLDILVNNAGIARDAMFHKMSLDEWDEVLRVNLTGTMLCTQEAIKLMLAKQTRGKIISISSLTAVTGNPGQANYTASKAGIIGLSRTLAKEMARYGITVNAVCPGIVRTQMVAKVPEHILQRAVSMIPLGRMAEPADIANAVLFLASPLADYVTGKVIEVDGGLHIG